MPTRLLACLTALVLAILAPAIADAGPHWSDPFRENSDDERRAGHRVYDGIPHRATVETTGTGTLRFRAPSTGRVWVGDDERERQIVSTRVRSGDIIEVDLGRDRIKRNSDTIFSSNLERKHDHSIYFDREGGSDGGWGNDYGSDSGYDGIPSGASRVRSGTGVQRFEAQNSGRVWIGNDELRRQIVSSPVRRGDIIEVDPGRDRVKRNGEEIYSRNLERKDPHSIFFERGHGDHDQPGPSSGGYDGIPSSAARKRSGTGVQRYEASRDGRIWVGDDDRGRQIVASPVSKGDIVEVDPSANRVRLNDRVIYDSNLERHNEHSIFFRQERSDQSGNSRPQPVNWGKADPDSGQTAGAGHPSQLKGATRVAHGVGKIGFVAKHTGDFWVFDSTQRKIVATGTVSPGDSVQVDPANNTTTCPAGVRSLENYAPKMAHEIYFKKN